MLLLFRLLETALAQAGLVNAAHCEGFGAELNDCVFYALVFDECQAVDLIKKELDAANILPVSQIGVLRGERWQCVHPHPEINLGLILCDERREAQAERFKYRSGAKLADLKTKLAQSEQQPPPEPGTEASGK